MIFVTVGTHEQPFNRLVKTVDELIKDGVITEHVIMQTGFSTYEPKYCQWIKLIPYQQMIKMLRPHALSSLTEDLRALLCLYKSVRHLSLYLVSTGLMNM